MWEATVPKVLILALTLPSTVRALLFSVARAEQSCVARCRPRLAHTQARGAPRCRRAAVLLRPAVAQVKAALLAVYERLAEAFEQVRACLRRRGASRRKRRQSLFGSHAASSRAPAGRRPLLAAALLGLCCVLWLGRVRDASEPSYSRLTQQLTWEVVGGG